MPPSRLLFLFWASQNAAAFAPVQLNSAAYKLTTSLNAIARRDALVGVLSTAAAVLTPSSTSWAAETIGKEDGCKDSQCIGVWDGLLADCPHENLSGSAKLLKTGAGCVCSQDDTPGIFSEP